MNEESLMNHSVNYLSQASTTTIGLGACAMLLAA